MWWLKKHLKFWWCHLVNACEVKAHRIGLLAKLARLFLAAYTLCAKPSCCCPAWHTVCVVIAALRGRLLYLVYRAVRLTERFLLTIIKGRLLTSDDNALYKFSHYCCYYYYYYFYYICNIICRKNIMKQKIINLKLFKWFRRRFVVHWEEESLDA